MATQRVNKANITKIELQRLIEALTRARDKDMNLYYVFRMEEPLPIREDLILTHLCAGSWCESFRGADIVTPWGGPVGGEDTLYIQLNLNCSHRIHVPQTGEERALEAKAEFEADAYWKMMNKKLVSR